MNIKNFFEEGAWPGSRDPLNFRSLNANYAKTFTAANFKFYTNVSRDSPEMAHYIFFEKGAWPGSRDPLNFRSLNANNAKTFTAANFKFYRNVSRDSPDMSA